MSTRVDRLITHIRNITENEVANSVTDISDDEIVRYINEAQERLQARIVAQHPRVFMEETTISSVADQEEYALPSNAMLASKILTVEYTDDTGSNKVYHRLKRGTDRDRADHISGLPSRYIFRDKMTDDTSSILLSPKPASSSGTIRVQYIRRVDDVDNRRAVISSATDSGSAITAITLDTSGTPSIDSEDLENHDFFCVVDKLGAMKMRNIQFDEINTGTGEVTLTNSSHTYESGESIAAGDYIVGGRDTSSHSRLPKSLERYLIQYTAWKIFKRDSSTDSSEALQELLAMEQDIVESYAEINEDNIEIPIEDDGLWL